jgi:hypothetical protein
MIAKKNDFLFRLQQLIVQQMQQSLQFGTVTIPSYKGDVKGCFEEARTIMVWAEQAIDALEALKEQPEVKPEPVATANSE